MRIFKKLTDSLLSGKKRFYILRAWGLTDYLPDRLYLSWFFRNKLGYNCNFKNPGTFNEKMQWLKLCDRQPVYTKMVDKYEVKKYVADIIGEKYIIPTFGVWNRFEDIDMDDLPDQFVLKCTHCSGGCVICRDKSRLNIETASAVIRKYLKKNYFYYGREWPYKNAAPRIIAEQYLEQDGSSGLIDYKFFCFNGKPLFLYISKGLENHATAGISFYDLEGREMPFHRKDFKPFHNAEMPQNFDIMKIIAEKIAQNVGAPFVRIDLYSVNRQVYFSEITFFPCAGMIPFDSYETDLRLGDLLKLPADTGKSGKG